MSDRAAFWLRIFKYAVIVAVISGLVYVGIKCYRELQQTPLQLSAVRWHWLWLAAAAYAAGMSVAGVFWTQLLRWWGQRVTWSRSLAAFFVSQVGKYVPGKAMVIVVRVALVRAPGVDNRVAVIAVFAETLTWMAVAAAVGSALLYAIAPEQTNVLWIGIALAIGSIAATSPPMMRWALRWCMRRSEPTATAAPPTVTLRMMLIGWSEMIVGWCLMGLSFWAVLAALPESNASWNDFVWALACATLSVVIGFASLIPGGMGVRELVIIPLLSAHYSVPEALLVAVLVRVVWLIVDVVLATIMRFALSRPTTSDA